MNNEQARTPVSEFALEKAAQAWCKPETEKIQMDTVLAKAFAEIIDEIHSKAKVSESQIDLLANFIMAEVPGEPSQSQGAVDTAIRIIRGFLVKPVDA